MQGIVANFRRGRQTFRPRHFIIVIDGVATKKDAEKLVNKQVEWKSPAGKIIKGKIAAAHGMKGAVRVIFERGLPGQALSQKVDIK
jgi:large subunit ribosomal protein L35Ae